jgi:hypothetical protein
VVKVEYLCEKGHSFSELVDLPERKEHPRMNIPGRPGELRIPFGKYKGELIENLPSDYIRWCLENLERLDSDICKEMENQLILRDGGGVSR